MPDEGGVRRRRQPHCERVHRVGRIAITAEDGYALLLTVTVLCATPEEALRAHETVGRVTVGLALDGLFVQTSMSKVDMADYCEEEP